MGDCSTENWKRQAFSIKHNNKLMPFSIFTEKFDDVKTSKETVLFSDGRYYLLGFVVFRMQSTPDELTNLSFQPVFT